MTSVNKTHPKTSERFSACESIAAFYKKMNIPTRRTVGPFGGKSYTWYLKEDGESFQIRCACKVSTLGFGVLSVESRMASNDSNIRWFKGNPDVDPETARFVVDDPFGLKEHEIRLPKPDKHSSKNTTNK